MRAYGGGETGDATRSAHGWGGGMWPVLLLLGTSLVWAFSFGLIKHRLMAVGADPAVVALIRLLLSALLFLPFLRPRLFPAAMCLRLAGVGALQYGVMYVAYMASYRTLAAHEVALFTILTPLYVVLTDSLLSRRLRPVHVGAALLAVAGAAVVVSGRAALGARVTGVAWLQLANVAFAVGQVAYGRVLSATSATPPERPVRDLDLFAWLFLGGAAVAGLAALPAFMQGMPTFTADQGWTLLYLGLVPTGLCFFLWNAGARRTDTGTLAAMNNAKLPLGIVVSMLCFGEQADFPRVLVGGAVLVAAVALGRLRRG